jgi:hypothetical protein
MSALINQPVQHVLLDMLRQDVLDAPQDILERTALIVLLAIFTQLAC